MLNHQPHPGANQASIFGVPRICDAHLAAATAWRSSKITTSEIAEAVNEPEPAVRGRPHRRAAAPYPVKQTFPVTRRTITQARAVRQHDPARRNPATAAMVRRRRRPRRARRAELRARHLVPGQAGDADRGLPAAGANAIAVSRTVRATLAELAKRLPDGLKYDVALDTTLFVQASIDEVVRRPSSRRWCSSCSSCSSSCTACA